MRHLRSRVLATTTFVVAIAASAPTGASGSTASLTLERTYATLSGDEVSDYTLVVEGAPGEANVLDVSIAGARIRVTDEGAELHPLAGCEYVTAHEANCPLRGNGLPNVLATLNGGDGADTLRTGDDGDGLLGSRLTGGDGNDVLVGGRTFDLLDGGPGADGLSGGPGWDTVTYAARALGVSVTPDGEANDGEFGEGDRIADDIESVVGGHGPDFLQVRSGESGRLEGSDGNDLLVVARASAPRLPTDEWESVLLIGGPGNDRMWGGRGDDRFDDLEGGDEGGDGADFMRGRGGKDSVSYFYAQGPVNVTLDGRSGDGVAGEGDNVGVDIETVSGSQYDDTIIGNEYANSLRGFEGKDTIRGLAGDDAIASGGDGGLIDGGPGQDSLTANARQPTTVEARDHERDSISCDRYQDIVHADPVDELLYDCGPPDRPADDLRTDTTQPVAVGRRGRGRFWLFLIGQHYLPKALIG